MLKRLDKLPKRKVTVDEVLNTEYLAQLLAIINEQRADITDCIVIYCKDTDSVIHYDISENTPNSKVIYMLEKIKHAIIEDESEE